MSATAKRYDVLHALMSPGGNGMRWKGEQRGVLNRRNTGWFGRWREYVEKDGVVRYDQVTRKLCGPECSKADAQRFLNENLARANGPHAVKQNLATVQQFVDIRYWPDHVEHLAPKTKMGYRWTLDHMVLPQIGHQRMRDISTPVLSLWLASLNRKYSSQSVRHAFSIVKQIFEHARLLKFWQGDLPMAGLKPPKLRRVRETMALTEEQVSAVLDQLRDPERLLIMTLFYTGMRIGEAFGARLVARQHERGSEDNRTARRTPRVHHRRTPELERRPVQGFAEDAERPPEYSDPIGSVGGIDGREARRRSTV